MLLLTYDNNISFSEVIKQKGLENVTVDDLVAEITPQGRGEIIINIRFELPASLHISLSWLPFRFGQVCSQVWRRPYMAMYFGFFEL